MLNARDLYPETIRPLRRSEYEQMVGSGLLQDERVELIEGMLVSMSPQGARHAEVVARLARLFILALGDRAQVRTHSPLALGDDTEPEPDLAVVPIGDYGQIHPDRALLAVEVAETLSKDRVVKSRLYARANIPEYWIVNLETNAIEVHRSARNDGYADVKVVTDEIRPSAFPDILVRLPDLIPPARG